jgi:predicted ferric reductase
MAIIELQESGQCQPATAQGSTSQNNTLAEPSNPVTRLRRPKRARAESSDVTALCIFILVVTLGLWWQHGGVTAIMDGGIDRLRAFGQLTGLIAALASLGAIILTARPAFLERRYGFDRLLAAHRWFGITTVVFVVAHSVIGTLAWAALAQMSVTSGLVDLLANEAWMLAALVSTTLFVIIGLSSYRRIRNALAYETWYFLHLTGYLAVLLGLGHQLTLGSDFLVDRITRWWWIGLAVSTLAIVIWSRIGVIVRSLSRRLYVTAVSREGNGIGSIHVNGPSLRRMRIAGGQFFILRPLSKGLWWQAHPFSVSAAPTTAGIRFTIKELGDDSPNLLKVKSGTRVLLEGPYGVFTAEQAAGSPIVLIAGGVGIAPIRAILEDCGPEQQPILIVRLRHEGDFAHRAETEDLIRTRGGQLHLIVGPREWCAARDPFSVKSLTTMIPHITGRHAFICGPASLESAVVKGLRKAGMQSSNIHLERFGV